MYYRSMYSKAVLASYVYCRAYWIITIEDTALRPNATGGGWFEWKLNINVIGTTPNQNRRPQQTPS